jgi:hypothetical protein
MPSQSAPRLAPTLRNARRHRATRSVNFPTVGQCFDVEITRDADGWLIRIPEIGAVTHTVLRSTVEATARECIASQTGIPIGYVAVLVKGHTR